MLNVDDAHRGGKRAQPCMSVRFSLSRFILLMPPSLTDERERERIMCMPLISRCDVHTTMLYAATKDEEKRFIFHSRWSCILYVHFLFILWSAITTTKTTTMSKNSKETMTKKQQDDLTSSFTSKASTIHWWMSCQWTCFHLLRPSLGSPNGFPVDAPIRSISAIRFARTELPIHEQFCFIS